MRFYSIRSISLNSFNAPFAALSLQDAKRLVLTRLKTMQDMSLLVNYEDLELVYLGSFDSQLGFVLPAAEEVEPGFPLAKIPGYEDFCEKINAKATGGVVDA